MLITNNRGKDKPRSIKAYVDPRWKDHSVLANPLFGTTTAEVVALFTLWGDEKTRQFMSELKANGVAISTSNGESADFVAAGRYDFRLVDSDDAVNRMRQGKPVSLTYPDQGPDGLGAFIVPKAVVLIHGAPHPGPARILVDDLLSRDTERKLAFADCAQIPLHPDVPMPPEQKPVNRIRGDAGELRGRGKKAGGDPAVSEDLVGSITRPAAGLAHE